MRRVIRLTTDLLLLFLALHAAILLRQISPVGEAIQTGLKVSLTAYWLLFFIWGLGVIVQLVFEAGNKHRSWIPQIIYSTFVLSLAEFLIIGRDNPSFSRLFIAFFPFTNLLASIASWRFSLVLPVVLTRVNDYVKRVRANYEARLKGTLGRWKFPFLDRVAGYFAAQKDRLTRYPATNKLAKTVQFIVENQRWVLPLILLVMTILFFWPGKHFVSSDASYYLSLAKNLFHGRGYVNPDLSPAIYRGPVFPMLISASYSFLGESFRSALILERIFWGLTVLASYFFGKALLGSRVGFFAALFVMFAGAINYVFGVIWTDGPLLFFLLVIQLVIWENYKNNRGARWYVLMGILLGLAYLLKQTVLFIAPLPLLIWIALPEYRTRQNLLRLLAGYLVLASFILGWMVYVYLSGGSPGQIAREFNTGLSFLAYLEQSVVSFVTGQQGSDIALVRGPIRSPIDIIGLFYRHDLVPNFPHIAVLFPFAFLFLIYQTFWKKRRETFFLLIGIVLFFPLIPVEVNADIGTRHNIYLFTMLLITCAVLIEQILKPSAGKWLNNTLITLAGLAMIWSLASSSTAPMQVLTRESFDRPIKYFAAYSATAEWINQNINPNSAVLIRDRDGNVLHILTSGNRRFETLSLCEGEVVFHPAEVCKPPYILFWIDRGITDPDVPRERFFGISETKFISSIEENGIDYVIVTPVTKLLYYYLDAHPDFEEATRSNSIVVFRVNHPARPSSEIPEMRWETCLGPGTSEYLRNLKKEKPGSYEARLTNTFAPWMGLSRGDIEEFENWEGCELDAVIPEKEE